MNRERDYRMQVALDMPHACALYAGEAGQAARDPRVVAGILRRWVAELLDVMDELLDVMDEHAGQCEGWDAESHGRVEHAGRVLKATDGALLAHVAEGRRLRGEPGGA